MAEGAVNEAREELHACWYMRRWVSRSVDGGVGGLAGWYLRLHLMKCPQCRAALARLHDLSTRLRELRAMPLGGGERLTPERKQALEAAFNALDANRPET